MLEKVKKFLGYLIIAPLAFIWTLAMILFDFLMIFFVFFGSYVVVYSFFIGEYLWGTVIFLFIGSFVWFHKEKARKIFNFFKKSWNSIVNLFSFSKK